MTASIDIDVMAPGAPGPGYREMKVGLVEKRPRISCLAAELDVQQVFP